MLLSASHAVFLFSLFIFFLVFLAADCSKNLIFEQVKSKERTLRAVPAVVHMLCTHCVRQCAQLCVCVQLHIVQHLYTQTK